MASKIIPLIPKHTVYVEPFAGGAAVMFNKPRPAVTNRDHYREVINDTDGDLINFYRQLRTNGRALVEQIQLTLYSEEEYRIAKDFSDCDDLERARRYFVNIQQSFAYKLHGGWGRSVFAANGAAIWVNKIAQLPEYLDRMSSIHISNTDASKCVSQWDSPQTFFYVDPPYPGTRQDGYPGGRLGYTLADYQALIDTLDTINGSFLLSNYECGATIPNSWGRFEFSSTCSASRIDRDKKRTEVVYRKISTVPVRPEIQRLYDSGKYDCFQGKKVVKRVPVIEPIKREQIRCNHAQL